MMSYAGKDESVAPPLTGGKLLSEITNRIVAFMREHYGRGPIKAKTAGRSWPSSARRMSSPTSRSKCS